MDQERNSEIEKYIANRVYIIRTKLWRIYDLLDIDNEGFDPEDSVQ